MSQIPDASSALRSRSRSGAEPRPPSPAGSDASFASSTTSYRRRQRDRISVEKVKTVKDSRFDKDDANVDEAMAFLSRPHATWDSAFHELVRLESLRVRQENDASSCVSSVSAYSFKSQASAVSRKGSLAMLPKSPPPPPDLSVGGLGVGGFSFVAPRTGSSTSAASAAVTQRDGSGVLAGSASGKSGVRAMSTRGPQKAGVHEPSVHPSSAPGGQRRAEGEDSAGRAAFHVNGQFVPRLAPKRGK